MALKDGLHLEIEHKFVLDEQFDRAAFCAKVEVLGPIRTVHTEVDETYYLVKATPELIYRHRYDKNHQDLTYKTFRQGDIEVRKEVRIALDHQRGNQKAQVTSFLSPLHIHWQSDLKKTLWVYDFADCEVVYYVAKSADRTVICVEFEALSAPSVESALATLASYERQLGFSDQERSRRSLFELLFADQLNKQGDAA